MGQEELRTYTDMRFAVATVVEATPTGTTSVTTGSDVGGAAGPVSSGYAAGAPRPTGLMAMAGGAAAVGAAAWGL
jgi:hypothetical protein